MKPGVGLTEIQVATRDQSIWLWSFTTLNIGLVSFLAFASLIGILGNISIIGAICTHKGLWRPLNLFIINLSIADLVLVTFINATSVTGLTKRYFIFLQHHRFCNIVANVCLTVCVVELYTHMVIALTRYCSMKYGSVYERMFTTTTTVLCCVTIWLLAFFLQFPPNVGWGRNVYDRKAMLCIWDRTYSIGYTLYFALVYVFTPISIIFYCYIRLFFYIREIGRKVATHNVNRVNPNPNNSQDERAEGDGSSVFEKNSDISIQNPRPNVWTTKPAPETALPRGPYSFKESRKWQREVKLARTLFSHFALIFFLWGQYAILVISDQKDRLPKIVHAISIQIAHSIAVFNVFVYLANKNFRDGMINFMIKRPLKVCFPNAEFVNTYLASDSTRTRYYTKS